MAVDIDSKRVSLISFKPKLYYVDICGKSKYQRDKRLPVFRNNLKRKNIPYRVNKWAINLPKLYISKVKRDYYQTRILSNITMQDSEMNDMLGNVCFERKETQTPDVRVGSHFNSPVDDGSSRSSKSPNSIEDLNKEIERLFVNSEQFGFTSFLLDKEEVAEGRRAPVADMLHCYKGYNRRKKRRSATVLGIRNYNESDSSNGVSSPDDNSGCEEYNCHSKLIENLDPPIIVPVPVGKSEIDRLTTVNFSGPFSNSKLQLSEDSAFAPVKSLPRCQSTPPEDTNDMDNDENRIM